jgi:nucleotide-binding universal stress UspA family protein
MNAGRSVKAAVLAAQPLAQVGDPEPLAQMVCEVARKQQATMLAMLTDGDESGSAADQGS